jgi:sulfatase maturation enzyme AslB (radical SAM superfamily)
MAGAMAGTAVLHLNGRSDRLRVVTLTVNNTCNLQCPHCYLQYEAPNFFVAQEILDALCDAEFSHLAVVGKEPLANRESARKCQDLILQFVSRRKSVSLFTNGQGLRYLQPEIIESLAWIDVSFDGGPQSYASYRNGSYEQLKWNLDWLKQQDYQRINAMYTLNEQNLGNLDDMIAVEREFPFQALVFSPYIMTRNHGHNSVSPIPIDILCTTLAASSAFMASNKTLLLFGAYVFDGVDVAIIKKHLKTAGILGKTVFVEDDPLDLGILRVTYDGLVLTPYESLHTTNYRHVGRPLLSNKNLNQLYYDLRLAACA